MRFFLIATVAASVAFALATPWGGGGEGGGGSGGGGEGGGGSGGGGSGGGGEGGGGSGGGRGGGSGGGGSGGGGSGGGGGGGGGGSLCPEGLYSSEQCCSANVLHVAVLDCVSRKFSLRLRIKEMAYLHCFTYSPFFLPSHPREVQGDLCRRRQSGYVLRLSNCR